jgi:phage terminase large subunit-like protein
MLRADPFSAQVNIGNVRVLQAPWNDEYLDELRNFSPLSFYKDQVDASSGAFAFLTGKRIKIGVL